MLQGGLKILEKTGLTLLFLSTVKGNLKRYLGLRAGGIENSKTREG